MALQATTPLADGIGIDSTAATLTTLSAVTPMAAVDISGVVSPAFATLWEQFLTSYPRNAESATFALTNGADTFRGDPGNTNVFAGRGNDTVTTRNQNDIVFAGDGNDVISTGFGKDIIDGGGNNDLINAGCWEDYVNGGRGDDTILGGNVGDVLFGGLGRDSMFGEKGDDFCYVIEDSIIGGRTGSQADFFDGGVGFDTVALRLTAATRSLVEAELAGVSGPVTEIATLNLGLANVERIVFIDEWQDLIDLGARARLEEAAALGTLF